MREDLTVKVFGDKLAPRIDAGRRPRPQGV